MHLGKRTKNAFVSATFALICSAGMLTFSNLATADTSVEINAAKIATGEKLSWFQCPCFRWVVRFQAAGGKIETREFLISSDALLNIREESMMDFQREAVHMSNVGALDVLWKGGSVGLGFKGVTWGKDRDRGYSEVLRTGLYGLINVVRSEAMRLDIRSGYDFETMRVNLGPQLEKRRLDQAAVLHWRNGKRWSAEVTAHVGFDAARPPSVETTDYGAAAGVKLRIFDFHGLELGVSFDLAYEHDSFRDALDLEPDLLSETLMMSLSYVAGGK